MPSTTRSAWSDFAALVEPLLGEEDDPALWRAVVEDVYRDGEYLCRHNPKGRQIETVLGRCSHWLRPHQTRWTADGGFAWPSGYGGTGYSRQGSPEHDWEVRLHWNPARQTWTPNAQRARNPQCLRVSVPSRTTRHPQAAIRTTWRPGSPPHPTDPLEQYYGYRKAQGTWTLRATSDTPTAYATVADALNPPQAE